MFCLYATAECRILLFNLFSAASRQIPASFNNERSGGIKSARLGAIAQRPADIDPDGSGERAAAHRSKLDIFDSDVREIAGAFRVQR